MPMVPCVAHWAAERTSNRTPGSHPSHTLLALLKAESAVNIANNMYGGCMSGVQWVLSLTAQWATYLLHYTVSSTQRTALGPTTS
jgi:hypothetical protein